MKTITNLFILVCVTLLAIPVRAQSNFRIYASGNSQEYADQAILLIPCGSGSFDIYARYTTGNSTNNFTNILASNVSAMPSGYTVQNIAGDLSYLRIFFCKSPKWNF